MLKDFKIQSVFLSVIGSYTIMATSFAAQIVTLDKDIHKHLTTQCKIVKLEDQGLEKAQESISLLKNTLRPLLPAAGLAAPQIGLKERIFIFSWDRTEEHLTGVINPSFIPIDDAPELGWEGCFSVLLGEGPFKIAYVPRYTKIKATYINEKGNSITQILEGFAAKVFQHEYDHLEGVANIHRKDAEIKSFDNKESLSLFMQEVKAKDKVNYVAPITLQ